MTTNPHEPGTGEHAAYSAGVLKVRCERLERELRKAQRALAHLIDPNVILTTSVTHAYAQIVEAEASARALLEREAAQ